MRNIYYLIWADAIESFKKNKPNVDWKLRLLILMTVINSLNIASISLWLKFLKLYDFNFYQIHIYQLDKLNNVLEFILHFCLPFVILNYFLIFYNNSYLGLIERYKGEKNKIAFKYMMGSLVFYFISITLTILLL